MRLPLLPCVCGLAAVLAASLSAQSPASGRPSEEKPAELGEAAGRPPLEWWRNGGPRIRPTDQRVTTLLRTGLQRSAILRRLVDAIEASDVIVYIAIDPRLAEDLAGSLRFSGRAGKYRYLRATVSHRLSGDRLIAAIAHELQHVVELVNHGDVDSESGLAALYRRIGQPTRKGAVTGWDTEAARQTGELVQRELMLGSATALAQRGTETGAAHGSAPATRRSRRN